MLEGQAGAEAKDTPKLRIDPEQPLPAHWGSCCPVAECGQGGLAPWVPEAVRALQEPPTS